MNIKLAKDFFGNSAHENVCNRQVDLINSLLDAYAISKQYPGTTVSNVNIVDDIDYLIRKYIELRENEIRTIKEKILEDGKD